MSLLVHAQHVKQLNGRKTEFAESICHMDVRPRAIMRGARTARLRQRHGASRPPIGETARSPESRMCYTAEWIPALLKTMTTPDRASLSEEIASWDGKSAAALQSTYERHCAKECFVATILAHIADVELQRAATWLLKKHLETGNSLDAAGCRAIFGALPVQEHWESKLHILQCVSYLDIPEDESAGLETFLEACLESDNKFVRAWTYNGFNELSLRFPRYRERVDGMLAWASVSEAASVRARIRNMTKRR